MAEAVYVLCAVTSAGCALLLLRGWLRTRVRLLFWSSWCFALLTVNNVLLVVDLAILTGTDLSIPRTASALAGLLLLLYGLIYDRAEGERA
ncbi:MAG TPA: DUF5985 family protein [Solirubrobacteraceae bacterium]|nr:DUF5985 family protein [Solirubrobacteraceae bacterium]